MNAPVRPIHLAGARALAAIRGRAQTTLGEWAREWLSGGPAQLARAQLQVRGFDPDAPRAASSEYARVRSESGCIWFRQNAADRSDFGSSVVGVQLMPRGTCADEWVAAAADQAWLALTRGLVASLMGPLTAVDAEPAPQALPQDLFATGSGAIELSCELLGLHAIADRAVWRSVAPPERAAPAPPAPAPLDQAAQSARVRLDAMLGEVQLELARVLDLRCGDVLRLPQRLQQPLTVLCSGRPVARAVLGERDGHKAVQIVAGNS
jgi:flagellar motor switch/type III secretory pathway protein FliN